MHVRLVHPWASASRWWWLIVFALLIPFVFHGCHLGGHDDDDLLKLRQPLLRVR